MIYGLNKHKTLKRHAKMLLVLFVMSILNISLQMPAHGAMLMSSQMSADQMNESMVDADDSMSNCHCPPVLCESVLAIDDQSNDGQQLIEIQVEKNSHLVIEMLDPNQGQLNLLQQFSITDLNARQSSEPPLLTKTLLLI